MASLNIQKKTVPSPEKISRPNLIKILAECIFWIVVAAGFIFSTETERVGQYLSGSAILSVFLLLLTLSRKPRSAAIITVILFAVLTVVSLTKHYYLGVPLFFQDLVYLSGDNLWQTLSLYKHLAVFGIILFGILSAIAIWTLRRPSFKISPISGGLAIAVGVFSVWSLSETSSFIWIWDPGQKNSTRVVSSFAGSAARWFGVGGEKIVLEDVADFPLPEQSNIDAKPIGQKKPNIVLVFHESVFNPITLGLPIEQSMNQFFSVANGIAGPLRVNIHGGASWISEFSVMTGLDTRSFGQNSYYLPIVMEGRIQHSLMQYVKKQGYYTLVIYSIAGTFLNMENFFRSIGADDFFAPTEKVNPGQLWLARDKTIYERSLQMIKEAREKSGKPIFAYIVTTYNHGPHSHLAAPREKLEKTRNWLVSQGTLRDLPNYQEYYLRLSLSHEDYGHFKKDLAKSLNGEPIILGRFGDHQPHFTKSLPLESTLDKNDLLHTTFFTIEGVNTALRSRIDWNGQELDIAYFSSLLMDATGLPLDNIFRGRLKLMQQCGGRYYMCENSLKGQLHRSLIEQNLLDIDEIKPQIGKTLSGQISSHVKSL